MTQAFKLIARSLTVLLLVIVVIVVSFITFLLTAPKNPPEAADVVLVIAGAEDGRHTIAAELVTAGVAENLVVSNPSGPRDRAGHELCHGEGLPPHIRTWCMRPEPVTTTGEAQTFNDLAHHEGWESAVLATGRLHHRRVALNFSQCTDLRLQVVHARELDLDWLAWQILREAGGFAKFLGTLPCLGER